MVCGVQPGWSGGHPHHNGIIGGDKWCAVCNLVGRGAILTIMESLGGINGVRCATWLVGGPSLPLRGSIAGLHRLSWVNLGGVPVVVYMGVGNADQSWLE